jgi:xanthine dehydrogenase small subunit
MTALRTDFTPLSDWRASAAYRDAVAANLLMKFFVETNPAAERTRLVGARRVAHG